MILGGILFLPVNHSDISQSWAFLSSGMQKWTHRINVGAPPFHNSFDLTIFKISVESLVESLHPSSFHILWRAQKIRPVEVLPGIVDNHRRGRCTQCDNPIHINYFTFCWSWVIFILPRGGNTENDSLSHKCTPPHLVEMMTLDSRAFFFFYRTASDLLQAAVELLALCSIGTR